MRASARARPPGSAWTTGVARKQWVPRAPGAHRQEAPTDELVAAERMALEAAGMDDAALRGALALLGAEPPPPAAAARAELLDLLAARRVAERARVVALPLRITTASPRRSSRRYLTVPVDVEGLGFVDFLLEAGTFGALVTPEMRARLGLAASDGAVVRAVNSAGATLRQRVPLPAMSIGTFALPPLSAYVSALPIARRRPDVGGLLGVRALRAMELLVDFAANRLVVHAPGHAAAGLLDTAGMLPVACRYSRRGVVVVPVSLAGSGPLLGVLDLSSALTILSWEAAALLGMECERDGAGGDEGDDDEAAGGLGRGYFGSIEIEADGRLPRPEPEDAAWRPPAGAAPEAPEASPSAAPATTRWRSGAESGRGGGGTSGTSGGTTRSSSVRLQRHRVPAARVRLVLGDKRLGGAAALAPPPRLAVSHIRGLAQLGLGGRPAVVLGADVVSARSRFALGLRAGLLWLACEEGDAPAE